MSEPRGCLCATCYMTGKAFKVLEAMKKDEAEKRPAAIEPKPTEAAK